MLTRGMQERVAKDLISAIHHVVVNSNSTLYVSDMVLMEAKGTQTEIQFDIPESINKVRRIEIYSEDNRLLSTINTTFDSAINTRVRYTISVELK